MYPLCVGVRVYVEKSMERQVSHAFMHEIPL